MVLAKTLKQLIKSRDVTAAQLSRASKVPVQTIHNWLTGHKPKDLDQLKAVADYLQVSIDHLCFGKPIEPAKATIEQYEEEINAGVFEVVLRRIRR